MTWIIIDRSYFCKPINLLRHRRLVGGQPLLSLSMYRVNGQNRRGSQKIDVNKTWYLKNWKDLREILSSTLFSKFWILFINLIAEVWAANSDHRSYSVNGDIQTNQTFPSPYLDFVFIHHGHNSYRLSTFHFYISILSWRGWENVPIIFNSFQYFSQNPSNIKSNKFLFVQIFHQDSWYSH